MSFKFNLAAKNPLGKSNVKIPLLKKKKPLLDDDEEDIKGKSKAADNVQTIDELTFDDALPSTSGPSEPTTTKPKKGAPIAPPAKKPKPKADDPTIVGYSASAASAEALAREAAEKDSTIYDYDAAYDALHAQSAAKAAATRDDAAARKPKYLDTLLESAKQREKDHLRARDKLLQREREAEGDEFADKEKFVTGAYKAQQEEARKAEEEEKIRQQEEEEKKKKFGMQGFHKQMLAEQERRHQEAMEAAAQALKDGPKNTAAATGDADADAEPEQTEAERIEELRKQGKTVILNEDGQVADKRQLLSAGLNVIVKPKPPKSNTTATSTTAQTSQSSSYGKDKAARNAQRERQTQMVAEQIELANKRKADEEAEQQAQLLHKAKSQKTEGEIMSAKERYLQRKREKEEAAKAAAVGK
ncbi:hypothetical protein T440DRAFT_405806 [Plenodomus tracheiphilus IPT5]|uniref:Nuclear speckle splicing regulatory protein 1 N-terminal domain-containing protein n=1 Tax=Plenodomus tracheiphilus IPT5 TaxID=1408161 RepID=A0A6A7AVN1_9PLEO|nr:hypothetical protein T440DRAFT_405806 [Plenodomus tracheiphilus IPT5]